MWLKQNIFECRNNENEWYKYLNIVHILIYA